ncbi:hypothetical protein [Parvibacter caecicola]|uniref:hypothetical protein n=1 Tax=Parvibacter caecicola TaxID=747645 RepID=UPI002731BD86|nr:hypothetical protein [Parvibacter caecicola]
METIAQAVSEWDAPSVSLFILGAAILVVALRAEQKLDQIVRKSPGDRDEEEFGDIGGDGAHGDARGL